MEDISQHRIINETIQQGNSDVQHFYENQVIFITGGSGFLGKQLIEKLSRSCNYKKIYMLMRPKKQKAIHERLCEIFEDPVFDNLKNFRPDFRNKIVPVQGDVAQLNIGLSEKDRSVLIEEVDIIFHEAATVNFTETLKTATLTNVRGTREVLNLGEECKRLKAFIYVSTAYTPATTSRVGQEIKESFYQTPVSPEALIQFAETLDEAKLNEITPALIKDWPNSYAFTKTVTEDLVRQKEGKMPIAVMRPAIVIGAYREPCPGWIDKSAMFGASGFMLGGILGILHVTISKSDNQMCYVPVDIVNNACIITAFHTNKRWNKGERSIEIIAVVSNRNPITLKDQTEIFTRDGPPFATDATVYHPFYVTTQYKFVYIILAWILHYIPGYFVDAILLLLGKQPILSKVYNKVYRLNSALVYFMMNDWKFQDDNLVNMYQSLSTNDRIIFCCDVKEFNWNKQMITAGIGLRKYIIKDGLKHTLYGRKKFLILHIIHYIVTPLYLYSLWKVFALCLFVVRIVFSFFSSFITPT
ncbi:fatty acyl-CoA reductase wat-like [Hyposmocoma kahamanoa]|uniref:fatty acyl-CoA reductase wat-like n=1 Tax=Hyposmocoma kahamanoa TaxID=1477025 RepID=UPI000E6D75A1|nr:fatty acyl-CoA reductase wat-like [Hyposmocoma kahamanoa]